jgi:hypothetical protein
MRNNSKHRCFVLHIFLSLSLSSVRNLIYKLRPQKHILLKRVSEQSRLSREDTNLLDI